MSEKEIDRIAILSLLKERRLTQREATLHLGLSVRQAHHLYKIYIASERKVSWTNIAFQPKKEEVQALA